MTSASPVGSPARTKKGKEKQTRTAPPPAPETAAQHAEETQAKGPLGAPHLTTDDPQILLEEAEEDEDTDLEAEEDATLARAQRWDETVPAENMTSPHYGLDGSDEFQNVWGR